MNKKQLNEMAAEYYLLKERISAYEERIRDIAGAFKTRGSSDTGDFLVVVTQVEREQAAGVQKLSEAFGRKTLEKKGLISLVSFQVVKVLPKINEVVSRSVNI